MMIVHRERNGDSQVSKREHERLLEADRRDPPVLGRVAALGDDVAKGFLDPLSIADLAPSPLRHPVRLHRTVEQHDQADVRLETRLVQCSVDRRIEYRVIKSNWNEKKCYSVAQ